MGKREVKKDNKTTKRSTKNKNEIKDFKKMQKDILAFLIIAIVGISIMAVIVYTSIRSMIGIYSQEKVLDEMVNQDSSEIQEINDNDDE